MGVSTGCGCCIHFYSVALSACCTPAIFLLSLFAILSHITLFYLFSNGTAARSKDTGVPTNRSSPSIHYCATPTAGAHIDRIAQITILTSQLEASLAFNTNLKTRLLNALDTLDVLQAELDAERRKNDKHLWMNLIQGLQREKEEMQEVVELLIKRGKLFI